MKNLPSLKALILFSTLASSGIAFAHSGAQGVVKQRMDGMSDIAKNMKIIGTMMRSETLDEKALSQAALMIQKHAGEIPELFPDGSTENPSEALSVIWSNWDEFIAIANKLERDSKKLAEIAINATDTGKIEVQFQLVAKSCSRCHEKFRLKK